MYIFQLSVCQLVFSSIVRASFHVQGGTELASEVRHLWPKSIVKIVAVTDDSLEDRWEQCLVCGVDGWLPKPFSTEDLSDTLQAVLQS